MLGVFDPSAEKNEAPASAGGFSRHYSSLVKREIEAVTMCVCNGPPYLSEEQVKQRFSKEIKTIKSEYLNGEERKHVKSGVIRILLVGDKNDNATSLRDRARKVTGAQTVGGYSVYISIPGECYLCSLPHLARDCPEKDDVKHKQCYHCNEMEHVRKTCTTRIADTKCYRCKLLGHLAKDCSAAYSHDCYACGETGHVARNCTRDRSENEMNEESTDTKTDEAMEASSTAEVAAAMEAAPVALTELVSNAKSEKPPKAKKTKMTSLALASKTSRRTPSTPARSSGSKRPLEPSPSTSPPSPIEKKAVKISFAFAKAYWTLAKSL